MALPQVTTVLEQIAWSYANLARADAALQSGDTKYKTIHHIIRSRLYHGLISGKMAIRSLYDDERLKMTFPQPCYYCGSRLNLVVDHLIPRIKGGPDDSDNLVWACRKCNSSKGGKDLLEWMQVKNSFPALMVLRRYLKIVARYCEREGCINLQLEEVRSIALPFDLLLLPTKFPPLIELKHWIHPDEQSQETANLASP